MQYAILLKQTCPKSNTFNTTAQDIRSPNTFDNKYYVDLVNQEGLFTSDQDLYTNSRNKSIVNEFYKSQDLFFQKFVYSIVKMGQIGILSGNNGEIRVNCSASNPSHIETLRSVIDGEGENQVI